MKIWDLGFAQSETPHTCSIPECSIIHLPIHSITPEFIHPYILYSIIHVFMYSCILNLNLNPSASSGQRLNLNLNLNLNPRQAQGSALALTSTLRQAQGSALTLT